MSEFICKFERCGVDSGSQESLDAHIRKHTRKILSNQDVRKGTKRTKVTPEVQDNEL